MENHSLTINISQNISNQCFHGRNSARTDVLKLSLIMIRQLGIGNREWGNAGNREWGISGKRWGIGNRRETAIGKRRELGIGNHGNPPAIRQFRESTVNPQAIQGIRQLGNSPSNVGNPAIRESGN